MAGTCCLASIARIASRGSWSLVPTRAMPSSPVIGGLWPEWPAPDLLHSCIPGTQMIVPRGLSIPALVFVAIRCS